MGCDIHCYVEFQEPNDGNHWRAFGGHINPGRSYRTFYRMAGVRGDYSNIHPITEPRGVPSDLAYEAHDDNWLYVSDPPEKGECMRETADSYVQWGSKYLDEKRQYVSHPDWHSHSWLTPEEFGQCLEYAHPEYKALLAAMKSLEASGYVVRLVFWFDN